MISLATSRYSRRTLLLGIRLLVSGYNHYNPKASEHVTLEFYVDENLQKICEVSYGFLLNN